MQAVLTGMVSLNIAPPNSVLSLGHPHGRVPLLLAEAVRGGYGATPPPGRPLARLAPGTTTSNSMFTHSLDHPQWVG